MPTPIPLPRTTWDESSIPRKDPYLIWAERSDFAGYNVVKGHFQVAVLTTVVGTRPWTPPQQLPGESPGILQDQTCITALGAPPNPCGDLYTGTVDAGSLLQLLQQKDFWLELNVPLYNDAALAVAPDLGTIDSLKGSVIAVIDHGGPFAHRNFLKTLADGALQSRVCYLWDQNLEPKATAPWNRPRDFTYGRELNATTISTLLSSHRSGGVVDEGALYAAIDYAALEERRTHGAHVLDLAAGNSNPITGHTDAASAANIIFVQLPRDTLGDYSGGSMTKYVLDALKYILARTEKADRLVINLSYGSTAGPHNGSSLLERGIDQLLQDRRRQKPQQTIALVLPAGNHFPAQLHAFLDLKAKAPQTLQWQVVPDDRTDTFLELWYPDKDAGLTVTVQPAQGLPPVGPVKLDTHADIKDHSGRIVGAVIHSSAVPNGSGCMVLIALRPTHPDLGRRKGIPRTDASTAVPATPLEPAPHGVWTITLQATKAAGVHAWVERDDPAPGARRQPQSHFVLDRVRANDSDDDQAPDVVRRRSTGNSLANGVEPWVVGASVGLNGPPSAYSAAGPTLNKARHSYWPDVLAPGDESSTLPGILAAGTRSGVLFRMKGTSVAAPQVARRILNAWVTGGTTTRAPVPAPGPANLDDCRIGQVSPPPV